MKIAFDENIPRLMHEAFKCFVGSPYFQHDLKSAKDYRPDGEKGDVVWISRFADDDGDVIISGDVAMRGNPHERLALSKSGLITYFFEPRWNNLSFFVKSAMLMNWWPRIESHMQDSERGQCWEIPLKWSGKFRDATPRPDLGIQSKAKPPVKLKLVTKR